MDKESNVHKYKFAPKDANYSGFGSPAGGYEDNILSLDERFIKHPASTYFVISKGNAVIEARVSAEDILVVDKAVDPVNNSLVIASVQGELVLKRFVKKAGQSYLVSLHSPKLKFIRITGNEDSYIEGVITYVIHKV